MLFNSHEFIFLFLPIVWLLYLVSNRIAANSNIVLVIASLIFYGWWDIRFLPLLTGSVFVNFLLGKKVYSSVSRNDDKAAKSWMWLGVSLNLFLLGFFKYTNFFLENFSFLTESGSVSINVILPIGISFFTFQQIAYLVDVKNGLRRNYGLVDYSLFVSFFPQLIAGPIVHHQEMMPQFEKKRRLLTDDVVVGLSLFILGLFKKVMIADNLAVFATPVFNVADAGGSVSFHEAWGAALAYSMQIYFDFSGYSDMALGLARLFGIKLPINFYSPYQAHSIIEFWRRWHITLSSFLRDYLYIGLGGNRFGALRRYLNLFVTMLLGGFWHGAGWGFVIWGALHGIYLMINHFWNHLGFKTLRYSGWVLTLFAVVVAWVFFRASTLSGALSMLDSMFCASGCVAAQASESIVLQKEWVRTGWPLICVAILMVRFLPNSVQIFLSSDHYYLKHHSKLINQSYQGRLRWQPTWVWSLFCLFLFFVVVLVPSSPSEFLYFQF